MVQTSCGMAVPLYSWQSDRDLLNNWATKLGDDGIATYWRNKNQRSIDGIPTGISEMNTLYEAAGGLEGLLRLASAWHTRVLQDEVVSHAFSHGYHAQHTERLAAYWAEALGGPALYSERYGNETSVVRMHSGNGPHDEMDQRAIACFDRALEDVGLARDERLRAALHDYFAWTTTQTMSRYQRSAEDVPEGLHLPTWSWEGLVESTSGSNKEHS